MPKKKCETKVDGKYKDFQITWKAKTGDLNVNVGEPERFVNCKYTFQGFGVLAVDDDLKMFLKHLLDTVELEMGKDCMSCPCQNGCFVWDDNAKGYVKTYLRVGLEPCTRLAEFLKSGGAP